MLSNKKEEEEEEEEEKEEEGKQEGETKTPRGSTPRKREKGGRPFCGRAAEQKKLKKILFQFLAQDDEETEDKESEGEEGATEAGRKETKGKRNVCVIEGAPGIGKTALLRQMRGWVRQEEEKRREEKEDDDWRIEWMETQVWHVFLLLLSKQS